MEEHLPCQVDGPQADSYLKFTYQNENMHARPGWTIMCCLRKAYRSAAMKISPETPGGSRHESAVKFLVKFCCSSFLRKRSSKVPRSFHDHVTPFFTRRFAAANAQFHGGFTLQTFVLDMCTGR